MMVSARSYLTAGIAATLVAGSASAATVTAQTGPGLAVVASPTVQLAAALQPLLPTTGSTAAAGAIASADAGAVAESPGDWIINAYWTVQPWVEYGVELFAWATEWLPWPIGLLAPQSDIIYNAWQPFAESVVYSFAFLVDGQFELIVPTLTAGIQTGITNLVQGEIAWILSFFPPLPPIGGAAAAGATTRTTNPAPAALSTATDADESEPSGGAGALESTPVSAAADAADDPGDAAESQPVAVLAEEPEVAPQPRHRSSRGAARVLRSVPAASAAAGTDAVSAPAEAAPSPAPAAQARTGSRSLNPDVTSGRSARAERSAR